MNKEKEQKKDKKICAVNWDEFHKMFPQRATEYTLTPEEYEKFKEDIQKGNVTSIDIR